MERLRGHPPRGEGMGNMSCSLPLHLPLPVIPRRSEIFTVASTHWGVASPPASPASSASAPAKDADDASGVAHAGEGKSGNEGNCIEMNGMTKGRKGK